MHRQLMLVEMKKWRRHIEFNLLAESMIPWLSKPVRPRMEKGNSGGAPLCRSTFEVFHASQHLHSRMTKRSAEHSVSRQKNRFEVARH